MDKPQQEASAVKRSPDELLVELVEALPILRTGERTLVVEISKGQIRRRRVTLGPLSSAELNSLGRLVDVEAAR
jgi:hypothetical protein